MSQFTSFAPGLLCIQKLGIPVLPGMGFPIRRSPDLSLFDGSPKLIAAYHVLRRLFAPRHPPSALCSLTTNTQPQAMN